MGGDVKLQLESFADFMWLEAYAGNKWQTPVCSSLTTVKKQLLVNCHMSWAGVLFRLQQYKINGCIRNSHLFCEVSLLYVIFQHSQFCSKCFVYMYSCTVGIPMYRHWSQIVLVGCNNEVRPLGLKRAPIHHAAEMERGSVALLCQFLLVSWNISAFFELPGLHIIPSH